MISSACSTIFVNVRTPRPDPVVRGYGLLPGRRPQRVLGGPGRGSDRSGTAAHRPSEALALTKRMLAGYARADRTSDVSLLDSHLLAARTIGTVVQRSRG